MTEAMSPFKSVNRSFVTLDFPFVPLANDVRTLLHVGHDTGGTLGLVIFSDIV